MLTFTWHLGLYDFTSAKLFSAKLAVRILHNIVFFLNYTVSDTIHKATCFSDNIIYYRFFIIQFDFIEESLDFYCISDNSIRFYQIRKRTG